jgi:3,4-dihydroxy 2-butanone 4-phosphate synthase/GTP cyclohydrolase II
MVTVADLNAYRQTGAKPVERVATFPVSTAVGALTGHAYVTPFDSVQHFAFVLGSIGDGRDVPTRLHRADILSDVMGGAPTIKKTLTRFAREGRGVLVYLRDGAAGVPANVVGRPADNAEETRKRQWLDVGLGAQILKDLGVSSIRLRSSSAKPRAFVGLSGFGIEIAAVEPVE